jgi:hypothetical protein
MNGTFGRKKRNGPARGNGGLTTPGCLLILILLVILGLGAYRVGEAYWEYYQVREQVREVLTWAVAGGAKDEASIASRVTSKLKEEMAFSTSPRNVRVTQNSTEMTVRVSWTRGLDFLVYTYPMDFEVRLTEIKRWGGRGLVIK